MRYTVLVSHGTLAPGVHSVLKMLGFDSAQVLSTSLEDGMGQDVYTENLKSLLKSLTPEDEVILLGDIIGGSPTTAALNVLSELGLLPHTACFVGLNLPMAISAASNLDAASLEAAVADLLDEAKASMVQVPTQASVADEDEDDI